LHQARARAKTRNERCAAADGDLIFWVISENVLADTQRGLDAVVGVVDVDQSAPSVDEFLVADDSAEPPNGGLVDGKCFDSESRLRVGGNQVKAGLDGVVVCEGFDEMKDRENTYLVIYFGGVGADVQRPAVDDASEVAFFFEVRFEQLV
jgi:hypothetical protein